MEMVIGKPDRNISWKIKIINEYLMKLIILMILLINKIYINSISIILNKLLF